MFFSLIIPVYNCEDYLNQCLESVMEQRFCDFELILVNDGSKDNSVGIMQSWAARYPEQIRLINKENEGVYLTRRRGLRESKGEYLLFLDADDRLLRADALQLIYDRIRSTGSDLLFFNATRNGTQRMFSYPYQDGTVFEEKNFAEIYRLFLDTKEFQHLWNKVFRRDLVDWGFPDEAFDSRMMRDGPFQIVPLLSRAKKAVYLDEILYFYRDDNPASLSHHFKPEFFRSVVSLHERVAKEAVGWKYKTDETDLLVKKACMVDICISAIKARDLPSDCGMSKMAYLKTISGNELFRKQYSLKKLEGFRKPVAFLLFHRCCGCVYLISMLVGLGKRVLGR